MTIAANLLANASYALVALHLAHLEAADQSTLATLANSKYSETVC